MYNTNIEIIYRHANFKKYVTCNFKHQFRVISDRLKYKMYITIAYDLLVRDYSYFYSTVANFSWITLCVLKCVCKVMKPNKYTKNILEQWKLLLNPQVEK